MTNNHVWYQWEENLIENTEGESFQILNRIQNKQFIMEGTTRERWKLKSIQEQ